jgi:hypothetical protein
MTAPILAKAAAKPAPANGGWKHFAREKIGLRVRTEVGHEVEQHEPGEDQQQALAVREIRRIDARADETTRRFGACPGR